MTVAKVGDIIKSVYSRLDLTAKKLYYVADGDAEFVFVNDDVGAWHGLNTTEYEIVGNINDFDLVERPSLKDIHGQKIKEGDYVAYAHGIGHGIWKQGVVKILNVNVAFGTATVEFVGTDGRLAEVGVFEERGLLLKDYVK
jgi:hypothetical protein